MIRPLRVAHVVLSLDVGGLERNVVNQVREGPAVGQTVSVVCLERRGALAGRAEALGANVVCLDKRPGVRLNLVGKLRAAFRALRPDIVHTHQIPTLFYAGPAARLGGTRVVHTEHGLPEFAGRARTRWLGRLSALHCDLFFCLTREMARHTTENRVVPGRKVRVIRNGIETADYRAAGEAGAVRRSLGIPAGATVIGTVGRLVEIKCHDVLIRAFAQLADNLPAAHLLLVGGGHLEPDLRGLAGQLGLGGRVHFVGHQATVTPYLQAMDCFALASRSEGTPQAVLEASVAGLPVVATAVGGLPEVIEDGITGYLVPPGDEEALCDKLHAIATDKTLAGRIGAAARDRVEALYGIRRMAREYHDYFIRLTAKRR